MGRYSNWKRERTFFLADNKGECLVRNNKSRSWLIRRKAKTTPS